jgi:hypothetical protein
MPIASRNLFSGSKVAPHGGLSVQDAAQDVFRTLPGHTSTREDDGQPVVEGVMRPPTHAWGLVEGVAPGRMDKDEHT